MRVKLFNYFFLFVVVVLWGSCQVSDSENKGNHRVAEKTTASIHLTLEEANRLSKLPLSCIQQPLPYKSGVVIADSSDLAMPQQHHPAFYGCFDWHSAVHGHWSLVYLVKNFPKLENRDNIIALLMENLTTENLKQEVDYFTMNDESASFERTYGWAWLLKLQEELLTWNSPEAQLLYSNILPLSNYITSAYKSYLPKLYYPIRVGEHSNTAFGLSFAHDFAKATNDTAFLTIIKNSALRFYKNDEDCPIDWEPSGYDFLSPCLQEMHLMKKVLSPEEFHNWLSEFLPALADKNMELEPGKVLDRSDGKLVHLDGLNFSRAWCLYSLSENKNAITLADQHLKYSLFKIEDGEYAGQHWLASFALYAYKCRISAIKEEQP